MIQMNVGKYVTSYTPFVKMMIVEKFEKPNYNFPQINLYSSYIYIFTTNCKF